MTVLARLGFVLYAVCVGITALFAVFLIAASEPSAKAVFAVLGVGSLAIGQAIRYVLSGY